ncbi:MAG: ATP-dependent zinc metalloprotease FtsH [Puniceicoccales bacterium]|jgi:cell division protease FtsH|nr:ATP-dependent zinc metalloprotease FtsH [Puniceicoccales bacterium]
MPKKNNSKFVFQLKVVGIWVIVILAIFALWSMYNPVAMTTVQGNRWSIESVLAAAERNDIVSGVIQGVPSKGFEWYKLYGEAKSDGGKVASGEKIISNTQADKQAIISVNLLKKLNDAIARADTIVQNNTNTDTETFIAEGRLTSTRYNRLIKSSKVWVEKPSSALWSDILVNTVPYVIFLLLIFFILGRQLHGTGKNTMMFGKSRAKLQTQGKKKITFSDVAGCDEAKEEVAEIVDFLKNPKKFLDIGGRIPKGCLMFGAPGTGKTLLAKAVAGEAKVPFFSMSGSDFVEMFVGVGASRVRDLFEQGRKNAPCILFIDEIDAVGRQRGAGLGGGNDEREQTLNSLLVEMDGFDSREGVIIMAATNRPDVLDSALLRPGRFDRQIVIDLPDLNGREEILKVHAKKIKLDKSVSLKDIARNTSGFSGADLENLLNESALLAARENKKVVSKNDVDEARDKIAFGRERKKLMDDSDKKITAYHEAGHAIVQAIVDDGNLPVHKVTIIPRGQSLGSTMFIPQKDILNQSKKNLEAQICCSMGGRVAEEIMFSEITSGASADIKSATKLARKMVCDWGMSPLGPIAYGENQDHIFLGREISRSQNYSELTAQKIDSAVISFVEAGYRRAFEILQEKRTILDKLAEALLKYETVDGVYVYDLVKNGDFTMNITTPGKRIKQRNDDDDAGTPRKRQNDKNSKNDSGSILLPVGKIEQPKPTEV